jgi:hypothetical protein
MLDFAGSDLNMKSAASQREREAREAARYADYSAPRGIRAAIAARLARLAFKLDADSIRSIVTPDARVAGHHG